MERGRQELDGPRQEEESRAARLRGRLLTEEAGHARPVRPEPELDVRRLHRHGRCLGRGTRAILLYEAAGRDA